MNKNSPVFGHTENLKNDFNYDKDVVKVKRPKHSNNLLFPNLVKKIYLSVIYFVEQIQVVYFLHSVLQRQFLKQNRVKEKKLDPVFCSFDCFLLTELSSYITYIEAS